MSPRHHNFGACIRHRPVHKRRIRPIRSAAVAQSQVCKAQGSKARILKHRDHVRELRLPFVQVHEVHLKFHRPDLAYDDAQVSRLHRQTDGLPLFVANAVEELATRAKADASSNDWAVPDSLVGIIERLLHFHLPGLR